MDPSNPFSPSASEFEDPLNPSGDHRSPADFSTGGIVRRSWELFMEQPILVIGAVFIPALVSVPFEGIEVAAEFYLQEPRDDQTRLLVAGSTLIAQILGALIGLFLQLGAIRIFVHIAFGREAKLAMLAGELRNYPGGMLASIGVALVCVAGFCLLIIPGIIAALMLLFTLYAIVDQGMGPIEAMKESMALTDGHKVDLFIINLVIALGAILIGLGTCGVGFLVLWPGLALVQAVMYHSLMHLRRDREALMA
jgi:hypothetical protein